MAKKQLRQLTREKFQEEVARELGIDLSAADQVHHPAVERENLQDDVDDQNLDEN